MTGFWAHFVVNHGNSRITTPPMPPFPPRNGLMKETMGVKNPVKRPCYFLGGIGVGLLKSHHWSGSLKVFGDVDLPKKRKKPMVC